MPGATKPEREIPYCTIILVVGALVCHGLVLTGNLQTSKAMYELGASTNGWSDVGIQLGQSLNTELDARLADVSDVLTKSLGSIQVLQYMLDAFIGLVGNATDNAVNEQYGNNSVASLLERRPSNGSQAARTLKTVKHYIDEFRNMSADDIDGQALTEFMYNVIQAVHNERNVTIPQPQDFKHGVNVAIPIVVAKVMDLLYVKLDDFWAKIKPAFEQVGEWLETFGDQIQATIETVSTTMDKAQKIFDSVMAQAAETGIGEEQMCFDTFTLFDASGTGTITLSDLLNVSDMYGITSLAGKKSKDLLKKYDTDGDGELTEEDFAGFVHDDSIPGAMTTVLRTFSKKLSIIAGNVAAAKVRDEVAGTVVEYLTLISAKNKTKLQWVSQRLTNASLPMAFTADILKNFAMEIDNPDRLTTQDVGQLAMNEMYRMDREYVKSCFHLMSNASFWTSEGFDSADQPVVIERVANWIATAEKKNGANSSSLLQTWNQRKNFFKQASGRAENNNHAFEAALEQMPKRAAGIVKARGAEHHAEQRAKTAERLNSCYRSGGAQKLKNEMLGGTAASTTSDDPLLAQAINSGVPAAPETLEFAKFLSWNASRTADRFKKQCFEYSGESSGKLDNFADQVKGMVKMVQTFILQLQKHSTPAGINRTEEMIEGFEGNMTQRITDLMGERVDELLNKHIPDSWPSSKTTGKLVDGAIKKVKGTDKEEPDEKMGSGPLSFAEDSDEDEISETDDRFNNAIDKVMDFLRQLQTLLPDVIKNLKSSRKTVSAASKQLNSVFEVFKSKGPPVFDKVGSAYSTFWVVYFVALAVMTISVLFYGFWASGWFGGPKAISSEEYVPPQTCCERLAVCCSACGNCMARCHDNNLCFWSVLLLMEVLVLVLFIVAIVLCILSGVKAFMSAGCASIYILGDGDICGGSLEVVAKFLKDFWQSRVATSFITTCTENQLMTCQIIGNRLKNSTIGIAIGSILASILTFQMIIESAIMHERARWQRLFDAESKAN